MSAPLNDIWEAAAANPYQPAFSKDAQFVVGFGLLLLGEHIFKLADGTAIDNSIATILAAVFGLSTSSYTELVWC